MSNHGAIAPELHQWLKDFRSQHSRPPRILYIGNVANNAYFSAKMLRRVGVDCDVLSFDYYHAMSCPEWEDADFLGTIDDMYFPAWEKVNLRGYRRPRWFAQGPLPAAIDYLLARADGRWLASHYYWHHLTRARQVYCASQRADNEVPRHTLLGLVVCVVKGWLAFGDRAALFLTAGQAPRDGWRGLRRPSYLALAALSFLVIAFVCLVRAAVGLFASLVRRPLVPLAEADFDFNLHKQELCNAFQRAFPDRSDRLEMGDLFQYDGIASQLRTLFRRYDLIQGFGCGPLLPLVAGVRYLAFEHGTVRWLPFQADPLGRLTALAYHRAEHVFVSNLDCLENAHRLASGTVSPLNHPYPEDHCNDISDWAVLRAQLLQELGVDFLVLFPTRHDWVPGRGDAEKGNDVFLRAFCRLRREGVRIGMVCCSWGADLASSKRLLEEGGVAKAVHWVEPLHARQLARMVRACDVVADQFKVGAFGAMFIKALALGAAVCIRLDQDEVRLRYGEAAPVLDCDGEDEVVAKLREVVAQPEQLAALRQAGQTWIRAHHSGAETVEHQLRRYKECLEPVQPRRKSPTGIPTAVALVENAA